MLMPSAVRTPAPVVTVLGATPAPPPIINAFAESGPLEAHVLADEKNGMPPDVPVIVNAGVVVGVATLSSPPVKPTLVTVPAPLMGSQPIAPLAEKTASPFGHVPDIGAPTVNPPLTALLPEGPSGTPEVWHNAATVIRDSHSAAAGADPNSFCAMD